MPREDKSAEGRGPAPDLAVKVKSGAGAIYGHDGIAIGRD